MGSFGAVVLLVVAHASVEAAGTVAEGPSPANGTTGVIQINSTVINKPEEIAQEEELVEAVDAEDPTFLFFSPRRRSVGGGSFSPRRRSVGGGLSSPRRRSVGGGLSSPRRRAVGGGWSSPRRRSVGLYSPRRRSTYGTGGYQQGGYNGGYQPGGYGGGYYGGGGGGGMGFGGLVLLCCCFPILIVLLSCFCCYEMLAGCCPCFFGSSRGEGYQPLTSEPQRPMMGAQYAQRPGQVYSRGVAIPPDVAQGFLVAVQDEYLNGEDSAVGRFFDLQESRGVSQQIGEALAAEEERFQSTGDRQAAYNDLASRWGMM